MRDAEKRQLFAAATAVLLAVPLVAADEPGAELFSDSFESTGTFAENWTLGKRYASKVRSEGGVVKMEYGAEAIKTRAATPVDFVADVDVTLDPPWSRGSQNGQRGWAGIHIRPNYHFAIKPDGTTFLVWRLPGEKRSMGKYLKINGFTKGSPVRLRVVRKATGEGVRYAFFVNGRASGDFLAPMPNLVDGADGRKTYDPPALFTYRENVEFDNFVLCAVKRGDDSPNMITNSGFEYDEDGIPPFFCLQGRFDWAGHPSGEYERTHLKRYRVDTSERHSGRQSLRVLIDKASTSTLIRPWGAGTLQGKPGVFSVWMKSSVAGLPVTLTYGEKWVGKKRDGERVVKVGTEWARYEVTRDELPGRGVYSPIGISVANKKVPDAVLWIDDLQAETVSMPEGGFNPSKSYATKWMPADGDKGRFEPPPADEPKPPAVEVPRLAKGVVPTANLDAWKDGAAKVDAFFTLGKVSSLGTEGYLACDNSFLYVGYRCFGDREANWRKGKLRRDDVGVCAKDSIETFFAPYGGEDIYQFVCDPAGNRLDIFAKDLSFDGKWTSEVRKGDGFTDYLVKFPLADFAAKSLRDRWGFNLCRNFIGAGGMEWACTAKVKRPAYNIVSTWRDMVFPAGVLDKFRRGPEMPPYGLHKPKSGAANGRRILGRFDFYMAEPEARFRVFEADGSVREHSVDIRAMPLGTNEVTVAGLKTSVVKLPYWKGATQINRWTRSIVHGGKSVLPTGLFVSDISYAKDFSIHTNIVDFLLASGIRQAMFFTHARKAREFLPAAKSFLKCAEAKGLDMVVWGSPFFNKGYPDMVDADTFVRELKADNILSQLVIDEPELWTTSAETKRQLLEMKRRYPQTPVQMNSTIMGIPQRFADLATDILMLDDYLANGEGRSVWSVVKNVPIMLAAGEAEGKPPWFFIESGVVSLHLRSPTYAEQVAQSWGCIAAGCTGLFWYEGFPTVPGAWRAIVDVNREVQSVKDVLLSEELCAQASSDVDREKVISLTKTLDGAWYVVSCNLEPKRHEVSYALPPGAPRNGEVEVLFENRKVGLKNGRFSDAYAPLERHVYRIRAR